MARLTPLCCHLQRAGFPNDGVGSCVDGRGESVPRMRWFAECQ
ncbi:MAG: hypothetical protein AAF226_14000 [Verrucomicrobiota bacterium]